MSCRNCRTKDNRINYGAASIKHLGTLGETQELLMQCVDCGSYYVASGYSAAIREVDQSFVARNRATLEPWLNEPEKDGGRETANQRLQFTVLPRRQNRN